MHIYLLKYPLRDLPQRQLPSSGDILRYYQFIIRKSQVKYKPISTNVGCKLKSKSKDHFCENGVCTELKTPAWYLGFKKFGIMLGLVRNL